MYPGSQYQYFAGTAGLSDKLPGTLTVDTSLPDGAPGIRRTVSKLQQLARKAAKKPEVIAVANKLKRATPEETRKAIFDYVVREIPYKDDTKQALKAAIIAGDAKARAAANEGAEFLVAPWLTLTGKWSGGDCDDLCSAFAALALASGFQVWYRIIEWKPGAGFTHINCVCQIPGDKFRLSIDPVMKAAGYGGEKRPVIKHEFFKV